MPRRLRPAIPNANAAWESGAITAREYLDATVFYEPRSFTFDQIFAAICAQSLPLPDGALGILGEISASHTYMLGYLNNEARETNDYRFARYGLRRLAQLAFSSCYLGLRKPGAPIYRRALDILGVPAERVLFVDDRQENIAGAESVGIKGIRFTSATALRPQLQTLGVL